MTYCAQPSNYINATEFYALLNIQIILFLDHLLCPNFFPDSWNFLALSSFAEKIGLQVWALAVGRKTEMLATGGSDAVVNLWQDSTAADKEEAFRKEVS